MLTEEEYERIATKAESLPYSAFTHLDYDDCKTATVVSETDTAICLLAREEPNDILHWAVQDVDELLSTLDALGRGKNCWLLRCGSLWHG